MMSPVGRVAALVVVGLALAGCGASRSGGGKPVVYSAHSLDGSHAVSTAQLRGKPVLLTTWATWCTACREELPEVEQLYERDRPRGLQVVAVNLNGEGVSFRARQLIAGMGLTMPIWSDPDDRFSARFRAIGVPTSVLLDASGHVVRIWQGGIDPGNREHVGVVEQTLAGRNA